MSHTKIDNVDSGSAGCAGEALFAEALCEARANVRAVQESTTDEARREAAVALVQRAYGDAVSDVQFSQLVDALVA